MSTMSMATTTQQKTKRPNDQRKTAQFHSQMLRPLPARQSRKFLVSARHRLLETTRCCRHQVSISSLTVCLLNALGTPRVPLRLSSVGVRVCMV